MAEGQWVPENEVSAFLADPAHAGWMLGITDRNRHVTWVAPPGGEEPPPPPTPTSEYDIACEFTGRVKGTATAVELEDVVIFRLPATGKVEVVVKRADVPRPNFFIASMTDVGFRLTVRNTTTGAERSFERPEGKAVEGLLSF